MQQIAEKENRAMYLCMYHLLIDFEIWELADVRSKWRSEREKRWQDK